MARKKALATILWCPVTIIDIFAARCAVTIFDRIPSEYAFISFEYKMIFYYYLLYRITAGTAVSSAYRRNRNINIFRMRSLSPRSPVLDCSDGSGRGGTACW
ncbi:hypothetical protein QUA21_15230 [Microcoleus sp. Pol1B3]|uniref:hypothetical protein n=1 Tax=unclassified Microcoleus TaxID=2642155 RepID=UPI002FD725D6